MKIFRYSYFLLIIFIFTACTSNTPSTNPSINDSSNNSATNNNKDNVSNPTTSDMDPIQQNKDIHTLDISVSTGTIPDDVEEMLVYGNLNLIDQIISSSDVIEFGMNDDEINDYGLWHDSINRVFCGFEQQYTDSIKGILTLQDGTQKFYNTSMEFNQLGNEEYCIGFNLSTLAPGGPYEFSVDIPGFKVRDIFNVYTNTLIVSNWEPNESIRIITYSHEVPLSPTGNFYSETYLTADENGELWLEIVDTGSISMWENNLIALLMYGDSGKISELFTEYDYSNIEENANYPADN